MRNSIKGIGISLLIALFPFYAFFQMTVLNSLSDHFMGALHISHAGLSALSSAYLYGDAVMLIPAGLLLDRFNIKPIVLSAFLLLLISSLAFYFADSFSLAICARFFAGAAHAYALISAFRIATLCVPEKQLGLSMSLILTIAFAGCLFAQSPFVILLHHVNFTNAILVQAIIGGAIFLILSLALKENVVEKKQTAQEARLYQSIFFDLMLALKNKQNWLAMAYVALMGMPFMLFGALCGIEYLTKNKQINTISASSIVDLIFVGIIIGSPFVGWLFDRMQFPKVLMGLGALLTLLTCALVFYTQKNLWLLFLLMGIFSSVQVLGYPVISNNNPRETLSTSMGLVNFLIMLTLGSLQLVAGFLSETYSLQISLLLLTTLSAFFSIACVFFLKIHKENTTDQAGQP